jgi:hypothetical protein
MWGNPDVFFQKLMVQATGASRKTMPEGHWWKGQTADVLGGEIGYRKLDRWNPG